MEIRVGCSCNLGILGHTVKWGVALEHSRNESVTEWRALAQR
jgi:hypothetical protein